MTPETFIAWRKAMGLSQREAAALLRVSKTTIEYWEAGTRRDGKPAPIPYTVGLACAALYHRIGEWG